MWDLGKLFKRNNSEIDKAVSRALSGDNENNYSLSPQSALSISAVWSCVNLLANSIAALPVHIYKKTDKGRNKINHPSLLTLYKPCYMSKFELVHYLMTSTLLYGNGYARIVRDDKFRVKNIIPIAPYEVSVILVDFQLVYKVGGKTYYAHDIIHIKGLSLDGIVGLSPIAVHRENLKLTINAQDYGSKFFTKGGNTSGVFTNPGSLKDDAYKRLKDQLAQRFVGLENQHTPLLLEGGLTYQRVNIPLEDAQFIQTRKYQKNEIASIYSVPPHMIGDLERSTNNNIEQQGQEFITYSLMPYIIKIEEEFNSKLLRYDEFADNYFQLNVKSLLRGAAKTRAEYYKTLYSVGSINANEIRELEDMNPYEGGDKYFVPLNIDTTENIINKNKNGNE